MYVIIPVLRRFLVLILLESTLELIKGRGREKEINKVIVRVGVGVWEMVEDHVQVLDLIPIDYATLLTFFVCLEIKKVPFYMFVRLFDYV